MATERIEIVVTSRGTRQVKRDIDGLGNSAERASRGVGLLKTALVGVVAGAAIRGITRLGTEYTEITNKLRLVTTGTENLAIVQERLFGIANRTRQSFASTSEVFARTARAVEGLGLTQRDVLGFTEQLNNAVLISGASATEAEAGLIQLSQGLASGALRGDELRSVLEQLPAVAKTIADGLGVPVGALRELGAEGELTTQKIIEAFRNADESLKEGVAKTVTTLPQAFAQLQNAILQNFGPIASQIEGFFAQIVSRIAEGIPFIIERISGAFTFLLDAFAGVRDRLSVFVQIFQTAFQAAFNAIQQVLPAVEQFDEAIFGLADAAEFILDKYIQTLDVLNAAFQGAFAAVTETWRQLPQVFIEVAQLALDGAVRIVQDGVNSIISAISSVSEFVGLGAIDSRVNLQGPDIGGRGGLQGGALSDVGQAGVDAFVANLGKVEAGYQSLVTNAQRAREEQEALSFEVQQFGPAAESSLDQPIGALNSFGDAADAACGKVTKLKEKVEEEADFIGDALSTAFDAAADALTEFITTGEFDFEKFVNSLIEDITRLAFEQLKSGLFGGGGSGGGLFGGGGGGGGGLFGGLGGLFGFANGGAFTVGGAGGRDSQLVAFRATPGERVQVNKPGMGGGDRPININYTIMANNPNEFRNSEDQILARTSAIISRANRRNN